MPEEPANSEKRWRLRPDYERVCFAEMERQGLEPTRENLISIMSQIKITEVNGQRLFAHKTNPYLRFLPDAYPRAATSRNAKLYMPPGMLAGRILAFLFPKKIFEAIFTQAIVDMRAEHAEALSRGEARRADWIVIRDHVWISLTIISVICASLAKKLAEIWKLVP
jgi:hypothetical protein